MKRKGEKCVVRGDTKIRDVAETQSVFRCIYRGRDETRQVHNEAQGQRALHSCA